MLTGEHVIQPFFPSPQLTSVIFLSENFATFSIACPGEVHKLTDIDRG